MYMYKSPEQQAWKKMDVSENNDEWKAEKNMKS